jgi:protein-L-isoaspartate(D-aspartate) O-methyltransferase
MTTTAGPHAADQEVFPAAAALADALREQGHLRDPRWLQAVAAVPRHLFAPAQAWAQPAGGQPHAIDRAADPAGWMRQVYAPATPVIIQLDDGQTPVASGDGVPTSSLSEPAIAAGFLELLAVRDGNTVLEIGTGSGWTAGLLSHRLGEQRVTTIEVDPQVAAQAQHSLQTAGYHPAVITGDGALGWPTGAPYDRVHVTCGITHIPYAWVRQCRPGAVIVLPWLPNGYAGHQLRLHVDSAGRATGRFHGGCGYMMMRSQRSRWHAHHADAARTRDGALDPRELAYGDPGLHLLLAALQPGVTQMAIDDADGSFSLLLFENRGDNGSWAAADYLPGTGQVHITQYGARSLWDEAEAAFDDWAERGMPERGRFGLTVDESGSHVWCDTPQQTILPMPDPQNNGGV